MRSRSGALPSLLLLLLPLFWGAADAFRASLASNQILKHRHLHKPVAAERISVEGVERRSFVATLLQGLVLAASQSLNAKQADAAGVDWKGLKKDVTALILSDKNKGPTLVRLAWHSSGTYEKMGMTGGSEKGTIRFKEELQHGANAGLDKAVTWLEPIYKKYEAQGLSHADLYTLGGVVAIEVLGGPRIGWRAGRKDAKSPDQVTPDGRLPDADKGTPDKTAQHLRQVFYRMGFGDQELVALAGAHALGRCHADASGYIGPWTPTPTSFNNLYFKLLLDLNWTPNTATPKFQYKDPSGLLMMLPADYVLIQDPSFKKYVELYANSETKWFADFAAAFQKLEELGTSNLYEVALA